jgi:hypothetical protein
MVKTAQGGDRSKQNPRRCWRVVNPDKPEPRQAVGSGAPLDLREQIRRREPDRGAENTSKRNTAVDNVMTQV